MSYLTNVRYDILSYLHMFDLAIWRQGEKQGVVVHVRGKSFAGVSGKGFSEVITRLVRVGPRQREVIPTNLFSISL